MLFSKEKTLEMAVVKLNVAVRKGRTARYSIAKYKGNENQRYG